MTQEQLDLYISKVIEKAFEPYADGTNDYTLFEKGFVEGMKYMLEPFLKIHSIDYNVKVEDTPSVNEELYKRGVERFRTIFSKR